MAEPQPRRRASIADACFLAGGVAMLASVFVRWVARGTGSGLRGHALVDAIVALGRDVPGLSIGRLTVLWYLVPALGAVSWISWGVSGPRSRPSRVLAAAALAITLLTGAAFVRIVGFDRLGWGPKLALAGAAALFLAACFPIETPAAAEASDPAFDRVDGLGR